MKIFFGSMGKFIALMQVSDRAAKRVAINGSRPAIPKALIKDFEDIVIACFFLTRYEAC